MVVARHGPADGPVGAGEVEAGARRELADVAAIELLPGRGVGRRTGERGDIPLLPLGRRDERVDAPRAQVHADGIAGPEAGEAAAGVRFRRGVEDGGTRGGAAL